MEGHREYVQLWLFLLLHQRVFRIAIVGGVIELGG